MDNTSVTQFTPRSEQQVPHTSQTEPLRFRNETDREVYEKFKDADTYFDNQIGTLINRLDLLYELLLKMTDSDETSYTLSQNSIFGLYNILAEAARFLEELNQSRIIGDNWITRARKQSEGVSNA